MSAARAVTYAWHPGVATRTLDGTAFILLGSRMLSLNPVGTHIWEQFEAGATVKRAAKAVVKEFETTDEVAMADTAKFVEELLARQLVVARQGRAVGGSRTERGR